MIIIVMMIIIIIKTMTIRITMTIFVFIMRSANTTRELRRAANLPQFSQLVGVAD